MKDKETFGVAFHVFSLSCLIYHTFYNINSICVLNEGEHWKKTACHKKNPFPLPTDFQTALIQHKHQISAAAKSRLTQIVWMFVGRCDIAVITLLNPVTDVGLFSLQQ